MKLNPVRYKAEGEKSARPSTPWKVDVPASLAGKRLRKFFSSRADADIWCEDFLARMQSGGVSAALAEDGPTVKTTVWEYVESRQVGARNRQKETLRRYAFAIERAWGGRRLNALAMRDVEKWLNKPTWGARTQFNALGFLHSFLAWCQRRGLVAQNVAAGLKAERSMPENAKAILSPFEMGMLLRLTRRDPVMRGFVVFGGFAGVRSAETLRLDWAACDWGEREIHVPPDVIKKTRGMRERFVTMRPLFLAFAPRDRKGRVIPHTQRAFQRRMDKLRRRMQGLLKRLNRPEAARWREWPDNCLRHSFASYLLAEREDAGFVAHQLGHTSPAMVHKSYARAVRRKAMEEWNALAATLAPLTYKGPE